MKRFFPILVIASVIVSLLIWGSMANAQEAWPLKTRTVDVTTAAAISGPNKVYGISVTAKGAGSIVAAIYNSSTATTGMTNLIDEVGEATQYETTAKWYDTPVACDNVSISVTSGGLVTVFYR